MRFAMPVRSLSSSVLRWPDRRFVERRLVAWAGEEAPRHPGLLRLGYFGSYARGDAGVGRSRRTPPIAILATSRWERYAHGRRGAEPGSWSSWRPGISLASAKRVENGS